MGPRGRVVGIVAAVLLLAGCARPAGVGAPVAAPSVDHGHHGASASASVPPPAPLREGERFVPLQMARPYEPKPPNGGTDDYRCFLVDPGFTTAAYVTGSQFLPQNADVLHHAIFFRVEPGDVAEAERLDADSPGDGWTCFGGTGIGATAGPGRQLRGGSGWIAAWAPGGKESVLAAGTGYQMAPGSRLVMQIHYNLLATNGKPAGADRSGIRLRVTDGGAPLKAMQTSLLVAPVELPCAPGETGDLCRRDLSVLDVWKRFGEQSAATVSGLNLLCNAGQAPKAGPTQRCDHKVREAGTVYAVAGHMHLLGRSIRVELNPGTPAAKTLLDVPVYDFDDQGARPLATPVAVKPGDTYRVTCTHDATLRSRLPALKTLKPRYVVWGEGTSDEMCLGIVAWTRG